MMSDLTSGAELEQLAAKIEHWRSNKNNRSEKMPEELWQQTITLYQKYPNQAQLHRRLGITATQMKRKLQEINDDDRYRNPAELCQIPAVPQQKPTSKNYPIEEDNTSPLATIVVELCRQDGVVMKIHTTTKSANKIINAFLGGYHDPINCQA